MTDFTVKPLGPSTWPDFAALVERHGGVWGGCWCMAFHAEGVGRAKTAAQSRTEKECRVREGAAHAALVYDGSACVGWCQFGSPDELPRIKHQRAYGEGLNCEGLPRLPEWRITCFFVERPIEARESRASRSGASCRRSRVSGAGRWKATPKKPPVAPFPRPSSTTAAFPCSRSRGSSGFALSARTTGL